MTFDWRAPDYVAVFNERVERITRIRAEQAVWDDQAKRLHNRPPEAIIAELGPSPVAFLRTYYRDHPWDFINDWGCTFDPRNAELDLPTVIPFVLFPKQIDWCKWVYAHWRARKPGITEKSRDAGISWLAVGFASTMCLHHEGFVAGFGSRKEEYVDKLDSPKSLFYKGRLFVKNLPAEFRPGWDPKRDAPHMRIGFPATGSYMAGEAGDGIGRGDRASIYFVDESAHLERPQLVDASLSQTTNCRMDVSSANGMANPFYQKRTGGKIDVFTFHWRDDPRKDDAWYAKQVEELDPVTLAQEIDINYAASVEGVVIPSPWVQAAVGAHKKLKIPITGARRGALDVADEGRDNLAFAGAQGILVDFLEEWSGKDSDIFASVIRSMGICDQLDMQEFRYDADGLGAGVRGDARVANELRAKDRRRPVAATPWRGSGAVHKPEAEDVKGRKNKDYFMNAKAQAWFALRRRFQLTYRAVIHGAPFDPSEIISLDANLPHLAKLTGELSQVTYELNTLGKIVVDKTPEGTRSPNLADAVMILHAPGRSGMFISDEVVKQTR